MKKTVLALSAAAVCGLLSFAAPASAAPLAGASAAHTDMSSQRMHPRKVCHVRKVVTRDRFGRRVVRTARVCR